MTNTTDKDWEENEAEKSHMSKLVLQQNKKKKKSGGFQSMGLSYGVFKGVMKKGYNVPTPIQRKTIPLILDGRDVVAMARTGSGKTAAFLIPLFQKLKAPTAKSGARSLILSPTRELALQTLKFARDLGRFTGLRSICVLGGESMEKQFGMIHENPDIIIATPGRFVHLCVEMGLKLESVEYVVFDEADRLFEMGFGEQLREILGRLPDHRQTVLFSATLPKLLVDFAKAGLSDPTLIRLDVDTKIPDTLKLAFFHCRDEGKSCALLHLLRDVIPSEQQTVVFCATRHHVEYLHLLLDMANITNTFIFSQLDSTARKINAAKFGTKRAKVLLVTDLAARGIDIPLLDNVINYNFPSKPKLFVHRVGRVARAGREGNAFSLVAGDELAYFIDLQLFLGNSINITPQNSKPEDPWHNVLGSAPQGVYDDYSDLIESWHDKSLDLFNMRKVASNGYLQYLKSRPGASSESAKRAKNLKTEKVIGIHPMLIRDTGAEEIARANILDEIKKFKPGNTIFEIGATAKSAKVKSIMANKRTRHGNAITQYHFKTSEAVKRDEDSKVEEVERKELEQSTQDDVEGAFSKIVQPKALTDAKVFCKKIKPPKAMKDEQNYIGYQSKDHHTEAGYSLMNNFEAEAKGAVLDLTGDSNTTMVAKKNAMKWDVRKKKYVRADQNEKKKIKTESGVWIPASYKSNRYSKWKERSKLTQMEDDDGGDSNDEGGKSSNGHKGFNDRKARKRAFTGLPESHPAMKKAKNAVPNNHKKGPKQELKRPEQVLKMRKEEEKKRQKNMRKTKRKGNRKRK